MGARQSEETRLALEYLRVNRKATPYAAAKKYGLSPSTLYRALQRKEKK